MTFKLPHYLQVEVIVVDLEDRNSELKTGNKENLVFLEELQNTDASLRNAKFENFLFCNDREHRNVLIAGGHGNQL